MKVIKHLAQSSTTDVSPADTKGIGAMNAQRKVPPNPRSVEGVSKMTGNQMSLSFDRDMKTGS